MKESPRRVLLLSFKCVVVAVVVLLLLACSLVIVSHFFCLFVL